MSGFRSRRGDVVSCHTPVGAPAVHEPLEGSAAVGPREEERW